MLATVLACVVMLLVASWAAPGTGPAAIPASSPPATSSPRTGAAPTVRLIFLGDVMLGQDVGDIAAHDPGSIFERVRPVLVDADLAMADLESPLTTRPHTATGRALEADPEDASLLAGAGLGVVALANDHATDAGPAAVLDTMAAVGAVGLQSVGAGSDAAAAAAPLVVDLGGVRVGILAYDMTGGGTAATSASPGVSAWDRPSAAAAVARLRPDVDLLVVALHGGAEDTTAPGSSLQRADEDLAAWGADVVWGHDAHASYPVTAIGVPHPAVLAPGLGSAVTDGDRAGTDAGGLLEVMADGDGVLAMRTGSIDVDAGRAVFTGWHDPAGDAVAVGGDWWTPVRPVVEAAPAGCEAFDLDRVLRGLQTGSRVVDTSCGSVTGEGTSEMAIAYRHPLDRKLLQGLYPEGVWADSDGLSAHLAVMTPDARMLWAAGTLPEPIGTVAACSGSLAVGYTSLDDPAIVAAGAWTWRGFGFATASRLPQPTSIGCVDIDDDGATEPLVRRLATRPGGTSP